MSKDPNYEVDPAEETNADDDCSDDDENPHNRVSRSKGDVRPTSQKKRCKTVVPPSQISTRSRAITDTEDDATEVDGHTEGLNGEEETTATMTLTTRDSSATDASIVISTEQQELLAKNVMEKRKRGGRREAFGHGLDVYTRRNGGSKIKDGLRRPTDPVQAAKLSTECGIHIRSKIPLATHWKEYYDKNSGLAHVIPEAIGFVAGKFDMDSKDGTAIDVCTDIFQSDIRQQHYRLKAQYWKKIENMTEEQAFLEKQKNVDENSWKKLVRKWFDQHYQEMCDKNKNNRKCVKHYHTTGSRSFVAQYEHLRSLKNKEETSPIEFYKASHINRDGVMPDKAQTAYDQMVLRKMGPHPEDHIPKTDVEIVDEVLKEQTKTITFLNKLCVSKSSRKSSTSSAHIKELEERLALQEQQSEEASKKYEREVQQRMQAHDEKIEELKSK